MFFIVVAHFHSRFTYLKINLKIIQYYFPDFTNLNTYIYFCYHRFFNLFSHYLNLLTNDNLQSYH